MCHRIFIKNTGSALDSPMPYKSNVSLLTQVTYRTSNTTSLSIFITPRGFSFKLTSEPALFCWLALMKFYQRRSDLMLILITLFIFFLFFFLMETETALSSILSITTSINNINTEVTGTFIIAQLVCDIGMAENVSNLQYCQ